MDAKDYIPILKEGGTLDIDLEFKTNQKLNFRDTGIYIQSPADGKIKISADGTGADDITLDGTVSISDSITLADAKNISVGTTTGTKIGTDATQKIGFFNATPIAQPSSTGETSGFTAGSGTSVNDDSTFTGNVGSTAYTIGDIVKHLKNLGLLAE